MIRKQFQVWHKDGEGFTHVANVRTGNLLGALFFTLSRKDGHWQDNPEVEALASNVRDTTLGDRIVSPDGLAYSIHNFSGVGVGFKDVDHPDMRARFSELLRSKQNRQIDERSESLEKGLAR
jgi:hypothetical protein